MQELKDRITLKNIIFFFLIIFVIKFISSVKDLALLVFASFVIAASLDPLVNKLQQHMKRSMAVTISLIGFLVIAVGAFVPLVIILLEEINSLIAELPHKIVMVQNFIATKTIFGTKLSILLDPDNITMPSGEMLGNAVQKTIAASASIVGAIAIMFIIAMIVFYMLNDKAQMRRWFLNLFPPDIREKAAIVSHNITAKVGGFVIAQSTSMLSVGIVTAIGLAVLGIPYAMALGLISGILDIVPIVGPIIATLMGVSVAYSKGWGIIIAVVMVYVIAQWISNNFIRPLIFGKFMDLHPLVILLSFLVAAEFLDVWGVILAPAIAAVLAVLFDELYIKQINKAKPASQIALNEEKEEETGGDKE